VSGPLDVLHLVGDAATDPLAREEIPVREVTVADKVCAISVDLDEIHHYFSIHGLEATGAARHAVYDVAIDRLLAFGERYNLPFTFFAVGEDLARDANAEKLREARVRGTEIANHSYGHRYDLTRLSRDEIKREIAQGIEVIASRVGEAPIGFRAPGYTITDDVFSVLSELGVSYDSSVFPCPAYYGAKTAAIGAIRLAGRSSRSIVDDPRVLTAPTRPYWAARPYWTRAPKGAGVLELPIQVTPGPRLPVIGTNVVTVGSRISSLLARSVSGEPFVNLELHGIDVLDFTDGLEALMPHQFDVRVARAKKEASLGAFVETLRDRGFAFETLGRVAERYAQNG
jgi:peptidoglycan/xylan/chitin deacetylase (PgdA/CDA1 family)